MFFHLKILTGSDYFLYTFLGYWLALCYSCHKVHIFGLFKVFAKRIASVSYEGKECWWGGGEGGVLFFSIDRMIWVFFFFPTGTMSIMATGIMLCYDIISSQ